MDGSSLDLSQESAVAQQAARDAGALLVRRLGTAQAQKVKSARDVQLDVDLEAERLVLTAIRTAFPDDAILSEEDESAPQAGQRLWIVDPLDGSFNFQHGSPLFGVIVALQVDGITALGVIYLPTTDEMYTAIRGQGAFRNGAPIHTSQTAVLSEAITHVSDFTFTGSAADNRQRLQVMASLAVAIGRVRLIGTAAGDFAWLACGQTDGVIMYSNAPWDVEAGALLVSEAGGVVTRTAMPDGAFAYVGGNPFTHPELVRLISSPGSAE